MRSCCYRAEDITSYRLTIKEFIIHIDSRCDPDNIRKLSIEFPASETELSEKYRLMSAAAQLLYWSRDSGESAVLVG